MTLNKQILLDKIATKNATIAVLGLGYVGLPLAIAFAEKGFQTIGFDISRQAVKRLQGGCSTVMDMSDVRVQRMLSCGLFEATNEEERLADADVFIICVPTPLNASHEPDVTSIRASVQSIQRQVKRAAVISLESTTYPGCTKEMILEPLVDAGLVLDEELFVCFSPERIDPGNKMYQTENTPKVLGGVSGASIQLGTAIYEQIIDTVIPVSSTEVAEMSKLLENTFRCINIAFMNEMSLLCDRLNIDIWETLDAAETKPFGFMRFNPGPGVGGHCIPLDPMYLSWKAKQANFFSRFIETAQDINSNMPKEVVNKAVKLLNEARKTVNGSRVLLMGMSYKKDINDLRESPSLAIYEELKRLGAEVQYCDPYVASFLDKQNVRVYGEALSTVQFHQYDLVILLTNHSDFKMAEISEQAANLLDTRNMVKNSLPKVFA
ncbi:nucleotide sugar dehydrogenase [Listeria booriae]|uniref:Nucleotide sugar dehydrogenase n=1 Tax=Listeria booriae TaxID=1552123 RepID=A0A7X0XLK9_9LIST|nr:nucleotide sugar dehydrogenase [Listeria booriae]MBC1563319.1 nucleotide sugar dehydrogenase [Listeria booriae]